MKERTGSDSIIQLELLIKQKKLENKVLTKLLKILAADSKQANTEAPKREREEHNNYS